MASKRMMGVTEALLAIRSLPAVAFLIQQTVETVQTNSWNSVSAVIGNLPELLWNCVSYWGITIAILFMVPVDMWIQYEFWKIPEANKVSGGSEEYFVREISDIVLVYTSLFSFIYATYALVLDIYATPVGEMSTKSIAQVATAALSMLGGLSYYFTVNTYSGHFFY